MKCLEKDRTRRYETANGLARDVERYLADEPVEACPPIELSAPQIRPQAQDGAGDGGGVRGPFGRRRGDEHVAGRVGHVGRANGRGECRARGEPAAIAAEAAKQQALEAKAEADKQRDEARVTAYASGMGLAQRAWEENNVVRARELLAEVPREAAGRNLRGFEWFYLSRLCHPDELTLEAMPVRAWRSVRTASAWLRELSLDGEDLGQRHRQAAFALTGHAARSERGVQPGRPAPGVGEPDQTVKIWDSATGKELFALKGHAGGSRAWRSARTASAWLRRAWTRR